MYLGKSFFLFVFDTHVLSIHRPGGLAFTLGTMLDPTSAQCDPLHQLVDLTG